MQQFLKIPSGMENSVDPDQTAPSGVCTVCICHFVRHFGVQNFRTFTIANCSDPDQTAQKSKKILHYIHNS